MDGVFHGDLHGGNLFVRPDGTTALHWAAVSRGQRGTDWATHCAQLAQLPDGQLWRAHQAGDLPRAADGRATLDPVKLGQLVRANIGKRGFTYTHWKDAESIRWVRHANQWGFRVNLSADSIDEVDTLMAQQAGPVVVVLPPDADWAAPAGVISVVGGAQRSDSVRSGLAAVTIVTMPPEFCPHHPPLE